jgi:hypothetical protein
MVKKNSWLLCALLLLVLIAAFTFPSFYASGDEYSYVRATSSLLKGQIVEDNIYYSAGAVKVEGGFVPNVSINFPIFLMPFLLFGFTFIFIYGIFFHLLNTIIFSFLLKEFKISQKFIFLYAFFPALFWLSRTIYPQTLAITFLLAGFLVYVKASKLNLSKVKKISLLFITGVLFGFAVFIRPDISILIFLFCLVVLIKKKLLVLPIVAGGIIPALILLYTNSLQFGSAVSTAYGYSGGDLFIRAFLGISLIDIVIFALALIVVYPLMLISIAYQKNNKFTLELLALFVGALIIQSTFSKILAFDVNLLSFYFINLRYLSVGIPFLILLYCIFVDKKLSKIIDSKLNLIKTKINMKIFEFVNFENIYRICVVLLILLCFAFSFVHLGFISEKKVIQEQIFANTPNDALIIGSSDDKIFFMEEFSARKYLRVDLENDIRGVDENTLDYIGDNTYFIQTAYSNREDSNAHRIVENVNKERAKISDFINSNNLDLELVFSTTTPHNLKIYKWVGE